MKSERSFRDIFPEFPGTRIRNHPTFTYLSPATGWWVSYLGAITLITPIRGKNLHQTSHLTRDVSFSFRFVFVFGIRKIN